MDKACTKCNLSKSVNSFSKDKKKSDGLCSQCKSCQNSDKKRNNEVRKKYYKRNKAVILGGLRQKYKADPLAAKSRDLKKAYGIDIDQYNTMLELQGTSCAICKKHSSTFKKALAVDHCHTTDKVRGLLCVNCNRAVGNLKDSIDLAKNLISYLEAHNVN
jgi:hypothetical protein